MPFLARLPLLSVVDERFKKGDSVTADDEIYKTLDRNRDERFVGKELVSSKNDLALESISGKRVTFSFYDDGDLLIVIRDKDDSEDCVLDVEDVQKLLLWIRPPSETPAPRFHNGHRATINKAIEWAEQYGGAGDVSDLNELRDWLGPIRAQKAPAETRACKCKFETSPHSIVIKATIDPECTEHARHGWSPPSKANGLAEQIEAARRQIAGWPDDVRIAMGLPVKAPARHEWDRDGERCVKCGEKDWMADAVCSESKLRPSPAPALRTEQVDDTPEHLLKQGYRSGRAEDPTEARCPACITDGPNTLPCTLSAGHDGKHVHAHPR